VRHELLTTVFWELILAKMVPEQATLFALTVSNEDWPSSRCTNLKVSAALCHWLRSKPKRELHPVGKTAFLDFSMPHSSCSHKQSSHPCLQKPKRLSVPAPRRPPRSKTEPANNKLPSLPPSSLSNQLRLRPPRHSPAPADLPSLFVPSVLSSPASSSFSFSGFLFNLTSFMAFK